MKVERFQAWRGLLHVETFSVWTTQSKGESKNWADWNMKSGKAGSVLKSWNKTRKWNIAFFNNCHFDLYNHVIFKSHLKWLILEMNCQINVASVMYKILNHRDIIFMKWKKTVNLLYSNHTRHFIWLFHLTYIPSRLPSM